MKKIILLLLTLTLLFSCKSVYIATDYSDPYLVKELTIDHSGDFDLDKSVVLLPLYKDLKLGDEVASYIQDGMEILGVTVIQFEIDATATDEEIIKALHSAFELIPHDAERILLANYLYIPTRKYDHIKKFDIKLIDFEKSQKPLFHYKFEGENLIGIDILFEAITNEVKVQLS